jgi:hypothetical protein
MMCVYWGPVNFLDHFASRDFGLVLEILRLVYKEVFLLYCIEWFLSYVDLYVALPHIRVEKQFFEIVCKGYQKKCTDFKKVYNLFGYCRNQLPLIEKSPQWLSGPSPPLPVTAGSPADYRTRFK